MKTFTEYNYYSWEKQKVWKIDLGNGKYLEYNGGPLTLYNKRVTKLPDNLILIDGYLDLEDSSITKLPDNLTINGFCTLRNTPIEKLPNNLIVNGFLDIKSTLINELPKGLVVNGDLYIQNTPLEHRVTQEDIKKQCEIRGDIYPIYLTGSEEKYRQWLFDQELGKYNL